MGGVDLEADGFFALRDDGKGEARGQNACVKKPADQGMGRRSIPDQQRDNRVGADNGLFAQMGESFPELPGSLVQVL